jgi:hypothetical protein
MESAMKPVCIGCGKTPEQLAIYTDKRIIRHLTPDEYVSTHEGTYNAENGHFTCDLCYIAMGMPTSPDGWIAP